MEKTDLTAGKATFFLSYRRDASADLARYIHDRLTAEGADVFFDVDNINAGRFDAIIEREIINREHFLVILTPTTLASEWVQREIQTALRQQKDIIPVMAQGFNFSEPLPGAIEELEKYSGIPYDYQTADVAIERIKIAAGIEALSTVHSVGFKVNRMPHPTAALLIGLLIAFLIIGGTGLAVQSNNVHNSIDYNATGVVALAQRQYSTAVSSLRQAIQLEPKNATAYYNLGVADEELSDLSEARDAYSTALQYNSALLLARYRLSELLLDMGDITQAFNVADLGINILEQESPDLEKATYQQDRFLLYTARAHAYYLNNALMDHLALADADLQQAFAVRSTVSDQAPLFYYQALVYQAEGKKDAANQAWTDLLAHADETNHREREWAAEARTALVSSQ